MKYDLVFEGGGAKGMVFVGALQEFEARRSSILRLISVEIWYTMVGSYMSLIQSQGVSS
jgi:hypothetical protein